jgi:hypothetical protein
MTTIEVVISNADQHVMVLAAILQYQYQSQADDRDVFFIISVDTCPLTLSIDCHRDYIYRWNNHST